MAGEVHCWSPASGCAGVAQRGGAGAGVSKVLLAMHSPRRRAADAWPSNSSRLPPATATDPWREPAFGKTCCPGLRPRHDCAPVSDIIAVQSPDTFDRPIYAGNAIARYAAMSRSSSSRFGPPVSLRPQHRGKRAVEAVAIVAIPGLSGSSPARWASWTGRTARRQGGRVGRRGLGVADNFKLLEKLAARLECRAGRLAPAVDAGYAPKTGSRPDRKDRCAPLYLAIGSRVRFSIGRHEDSR